MLNAIFDFNGTMFFDETFQEKAWQQYMTEKLGRRITPEEFQTWVHGRNTGDTLEYFFGRDRKSTRLNSSHRSQSRMPSSA